jgi:hypothetical protein
MEKKEDKKHRKEKRELVSRMPEGKKKGCRTKSEKAVSEKLSKLTKYVKLHV